MKLTSLLSEDTGNLDALADKLHDFSTVDHEASEAWDVARSMYHNPEENDPDYDPDFEDHDGSLDPGNAVTYYMERIYKCILHNDFEGTIVERADLVDELEALTDDQRQELYDKMYENAENGLT